MEVIFVPHSIDGHHCHFVISFDGFIVLSLNAQTR
jgi:hypothetical protein